MNIIIIGCGKLGTQLAGMLCTKGHVVVGLRRHPDEQAEDRLPFSMLYADAASDAGMELLKAHQPLTDLVLVTASPGLRAGGDNNLDTIARQIHKHFSDCRVIYTSSTYVYASGDGSEETGPFAGDQRARQLLAIEQEFLKLRHCLILRLSALVGPRRQHLRERILAADQELLMNGPLLRQFNYIHDADAAEVLLQIMEMDFPSGIWNLSNPDKISAGDFYKACIKNLGRQLQVVERDQSQMDKHIPIERLINYIGQRRWRHFLD